MTPLTALISARALAFIALFSFFMLTGSRERPWADATPIWQVADSLVTRGAVDIPTAWPPTLPKGRDGKVYAVAPLLQSLVQVPGAALQRLLSRSPRIGDGAWPMLSHLSCAALGALTCVLFFGILRRLGLSLRGAVLSTGALAAGTTIWVYARYPYSEILQAVCFTGFFGQLLKARDKPDRREALWLGVWVGLLVNAKIIYIACIPGGAIWLAWHLRDRRHDLLKLFAWAALSATPFAIMFLGYNYVRWGAWLNSGYDTKGAATQERVIWGLWGLLLSPGKSIFLYSPPLLLSLAALPRLLRRVPALLVAMLATLGPVLLLNASLLYWSGDYAWGPRYLVFAVPVLLVPGAFLIDDLLAARRRLTLAALGAVLALGLFVQVIGNAFFWDHYIRLQREARHRWLGVPNATGSPFPDFGGVCGACFEDMHPMLWLPPFQPVEGHWWLLKHVPFGDDWATAEADAPWHRYTKLKLNIAATYGAARVDWWFLDFRDSTSRPAGIPLLVLMLAGVAVPVVVIRRATRARPP